jgi:hypothetical protein
LWNTASNCNVNVLRLGYFEKYADVFISTYVMTVLAITSTDFARHCFLSLVFMLYGNFMSFFNIADILFNIIVFLC